MQWIYTPFPVDYLHAMSMMDSHVSFLQSQQGQMIWGLQHNCVYTAGRSAKTQDVLDTAHSFIPVVETQRGGQYTYHGPGQLIIYCFLRLTYYQNDIRLFIKTLEMWVQEALAALGCLTTRECGRTGLWVENKKIVALGMRIQKGLSCHGLSINVSNDLEPFKGIVPCGLDNYGVTSLHEMGIFKDCFHVWQSLRKHSFILNAS